MKKLQPIIWSVSTLMIVALLALITPNIITLWEPTNPQISIGMVTSDENQNLTEATQEITAPLNVSMYLSNLKGTQKQQGKSIRIHYGPKSQTEPYNYPYSQIIEYPEAEANLLELLTPTKLQSGNGLSTGFEITFPAPGNYYLRGQAIIGKQTIWSTEELKVTVK